MAISDEALDHQIEVEETLLEVLRFHARLGVASPIAKADTGRDATEARLGALKKIKADRQLAAATSRTPPL